MLCIVSAYIGYMVLNHWRRPSKILAEQTKIWGFMVITDESIGVSHLLRARVQAALTQ